MRIAESLMPQITSVGTRRMVDFAPFSISAADHERGIVDAGCVSSYGWLSDTGPSARNHSTGRLASVDAGRST